MPAGAGYGYQGSGNGVTNWQSNVAAQAATDSYANAEARRFANPPPSLLGGIGDDLERLIKRCEMANEDDAASQRKQRDMNVDAALKASTQLAEGSRPCMRALNHLAMTPEPVVAFDAAPGNTRGDPQLAQVGAATSKVIALVGMQLVRPAPGPTTTAAHRWQGIDQFLEHYRVMPIGGNSLTKAVLA